MPPKLAETEYDPGRGQPAKAQEVVLSDAQFSKLVDLLTPGYEASKLMLAELKARESDKVASDNTQSGDPA